MEIVFINGQVLKWYDGWDLSNVARAERWIKDHGFVIFSCHNLRGKYIITVRSA